MKKSSKALTPTYKYSQLYDILLTRITSGEWKSGERLPSERELSRRYNVSRGTVQDAFARLEKEGYIHLRQGDGSYLSELFSPDKLTRAYTLRQDAAPVLNAAYTEKLLSWQVVSAMGHVQEILRQNAGAPVTEAIYCLYADQVPYAIRTSYIPQLLYPFLTRELAEQSGFYEGIRTFHITPAETHETLRAVTLTREESLALGLKKQGTAVCLEHTVFSFDAVIEYTITVTRSDYFYYTVQNPQA